MARGEGSEKRSTTEAADQLRLFLPVLIQALSLQLLPLEFIPLLNLQISVEVGQLQRRKIQLREEEKRGRLTTSCMVTNDSPEETDLREETPEVGRTSRGPGCSRSRSRSRTRMSKGPLCTAWSPPALRPQAHPPASADTASSGSPGASAACARALGRQAGSPSSLDPGHLCTPGRRDAGARMLGSPEKLLPACVTWMKSKPQGLESRSYLWKTSN